MAKPGSLPAAENAESDGLAMAAKFEALFTEFAPPAPGPAADKQFADGLTFELPPDLPAPPPGTLARTKPRHARSEPYVDPAPARLKAPSPETLKPAQDQGDALGDAIAVLRAAEARGKAANERAARKPLDEDDEPVAAQPQVRERTRTRKPRADALSEPAPVAANESWSTRSRSMWPKVLGASALALVVGSGLGYLFGTAPELGASRAKIQVTAEGGTQLKPEQELKGR